MSRNREHHDQHCGAGEEAPGAAAPVGETTDLPAAAGPEQTGNQRATIPAAAPEAEAKAGDRAAQAPAAGTAPADFAAEAEALAGGLERFYREHRVEMPSSAELAQLRALQEALRDLVARGAAGAAAAQKELDKASAECERLKAALARAKADFLNYQQRASNDLKRAEEFALRSYVGELLPILDSFDLALADLNSGNDQLEHVGQVLRMLAESLQHVLKVRGLERLSAAGQPFDPLRHEAVSTRPADPAKGEQVNMAVEQLRPGYLWKGLLLRPAQVVITTAPPAPEQKPA